MTGRASSLAPLRSSHLVRLLLAALLLCGCAGRGQPTSLTGKTVYRGMGVEQVQIVAAAGGREVGRTRSGYHGSWRLSLPPGRYLLSATGRAGAVALTGRLEVEVAPGRRDQLLLELAPADSP